MTTFFPVTITINGEPLMVYFQSEADREKFIEFMSNSKKDFEKLINRLILLGEKP